MAGPGGGSHGGGGGRGSFGGGFNGGSFGGGQHGGFNGGPAVLVLWEWAAVLCPWVAGIADAVMAVDAAA